MSKPEITLESITASKQLPSLPSVAVELLDLANDPESGLIQFSRVVSKDPALCVRILKAANSPALGGTREIFSIEQAVAQLGQSRTVTQALGFYLTDDVKAWPMREQYRQYWLKSTVNAAACQILANKKKIKIDSVDFFLVGLLLDVGQLAMLKSIKDRYWQVYELSIEDDKALHLLEQESFGFDHAAVGAKLLEKWKLPTLIASLIESHHLDHSEADEINCCRVAACCSDYLIGEKNNASFTRVKTSVDSLFPNADIELPELILEIENATRMYADAMQIDCDGLPDATDLMGEAMEAVLNRQVNH